MTAVALDPGQVALVSVVIPSVVFRRALRQAVRLVGGTASSWLTAVALKRKLICVNNAEQYAMFLFIYTVTVLIFKRIGNEDVIHSL